MICIVNVAALAWSNCVTRSRGRSTPLKLFRTSRSGRDENQLDVVWNATSFLTCLPFFEEPISKDSVFLCLPVSWALEQCKSVLSDDVARGKLGGGGESSLDFYKRSMWRVSTERLTSSPYSKSILIDNQGNLEDFILIIFPDRQWTLQC